MREQPTISEDAPQSLLGRIFHGWIKPIAIVLIVLTTFRSAVADWNDVPTQSMEPTILVGDRIVVNKLAYGLKFPFTTWHLLRWSEPARGEIVVFYAPQTGTRTVKRVIGLPGDRVALVDNRLVINGEPVDLAPSTARDLGADDLTDPPPHLFLRETLGDVQHALLWQPMRLAKRDYGPVEVPDGHYLLMGDNRDVSADSRSFGFVPGHRILGRVGTVAASLDKDGGYRPRWDRFLHGVE